MPPTTNVYIDGFNLYKGCISGTPYKWLNPFHLAELLLCDHSVREVNYFTAIVKDRVEDPQQSQRQDTYLKALETIPGVVAHLGHFRTRKKRVWVLQEQSDGGHFATAKVTEEKGTDVMLATRLVWDACHQMMHRALVVTNDSDFQASIELAMGEGIDVVTVNPHHHVGQRDHLKGTDHRRIRRGHLERSQLPSTVHAADGTQIRKPVEWGP